MNFFFNDFLLQIVIQSYHKNYNSIIMIIIEERSQNKKLKKK